MSDHTKTSTGAVLLAFAAGAAAGAVAALLLAPRKGRETRELLASTAKGAKDLVTRVPEAVREAGDAGRRAFTEAVGG
jgi:gas vesicle protein